MKKYYSFIIIFSRKKRTSICDFCRQSLKVADESRFDSSDFVASKKESSILFNNKLNVFPEDDKLGVKLTAFR